MKRMISTIAMMVSFVTVAGMSACLKGRDHTPLDDQGSHGDFEGLDREGQASAGDAPADGEELDQLREMERRFQSAREAYHD